MISKIQQIFLQVDFIMVIILKLSLYISENLDNYVC